MTLVLYDTLGWDILPVSSVGDKEFPLNRNSIEIFKGVLDSINMKISVGEVLGELLEVNTSKQQN